MFDWSITLYNAILKADQRYKGVHMNALRIDSFSKTYADGSTTGIVLAKTRDDRFVTWEYTSFNNKGDTLKDVRKFDSEDHNCYYGHYYPIMNTAFADMTKRTGRL